MKNRHAYNTLLRSKSKLNILPIPVLYSIILLLLPWKPSTTSLLSSVSTKFSFSLLSEPSSSFPSSSASSSSFPSQASRRTSSSPRVRRKTLSSSLHQPLAPTAPTIPSTSISSTPGVTVSTRTYSLSRPLRSLSSCSSSSKTFRLTAPRNPPALGSRTPAGIRSNTLCSSPVSRDNNSCVPPQTIPSSVPSCFFVARLPRELKSRSIFLLLWWWCSHFLSPFPLPPRLSRRRIGRR